MKNKNSKTVTIILVLILLAGLSLLLYPSISDYWNSFHSTRVIDSYVKELESMDTSRFDEQRGKADLINEVLAGTVSAADLPGEMKDVYERALNIDGSGMMGYIDIQKIRVNLPIYHGTDETVLQIGVGHMEWSSLPVGGESTHCVLSSHRGLPSAKLFTNLDKLNSGDVFELHILDEVLTYEVDQILIVKPDEIDDLKIVEGKDYCTLVTCTPYGINTHRLLVRGHRIENLVDESAKVIADAGMIQPLYVAPILAIPILAVLLVVLLYPGKRR